MSLRRKKVNILLIILSLILGGWAVWLYRRPPLVLSPENNMVDQSPSVSDTLVIAPDTPAVPVSETGTADPIPTPPSTIDTSDKEKTVTRIETTSFKDIQPRTMLSDHPFRKEALKVINGHLEESDSVSRHKILSYCEHLRTSYTTRDIDFIRQVFSDNALIIVGHVVRSGNSNDKAMSYNDRVSYSIRSKQSYLENLSRIFNSGKEIDVKFSDFRIMRHPTVKGIYGVTLKQDYAAGSYSDSGYLFLLWDFRDMSMPLIHVRTWQPTSPIENGEDEIIGISDFNLE